MVSPDGYVQGMPNWCHNTLTVTGPADELRAFAADAKTETQPLSFERHVPVPAELFERSAPPDAHLAALFAGLAEGFEIDLSQGSTPLGPPIAWAPGVRVGNEAWQARVAPHPTDDWYAYQLRVRGCKWDANFDGPGIALMHEDAETPTGGSVLDVTGDEIQYSFTTAWSPPLNWLALVAELYPTLEFRLEYAECGNDFAGRTRLRGCEVLEAVELEVDDVLADADRWF